MKTTKPKRLLTEKEALWLIDYDPNAENGNEFISKEQWEKLELLLDLGIYKG